MFENCRPFDIQFIQKASPSKGDAFDFTLVYKFFTERTELYQGLKYILRVEVFGDVYAIKFYAARDRKLDNKYSRVENVKGVFHTSTCEYEWSKLRKHLQD